MANPWQTLIANVRKSNPGLSFKDTLIKAGKSYTPPAMVRAYAKLRNIARAKAKVARARSMVARAQSVVARARSVVVRAKSK